MIEEEELENKPELHQEEDSIGVSGMFESWFLGNFRKSCSIHI